MSSENSRDRVDYRSTLPDSNALEAHADGLIDDLFADIDNILEGGTKLPNSPDYPALKPGEVPQVTLPSATSTEPKIGSLPPAGKSSTSSNVPPLGYTPADVPQDRWLRDRMSNLTPNEISDTSAPEVEEDSPDPLESDIPEEKEEFKEAVNGAKPLQFPDKLLLGGIIATLASLAALFFLWLVSQYRLNVLRTANATNSQATVVSQAEREFIDYMERSLKAIDQKKPGLPSPPGQQNLSPSSNLPVLTPALPSLPPASPSKIPIAVPEPRAR